MAGSFSSRQKLALLALISIGLCCEIAFAYHRYMYQFGYRTCTLRCVQSALLVYAGEHQGNFPYSEKGPYDAIRKLYPEYTPTGIELAGVSGNVENVVRVLRENLPFDQSATSWVYVQGLRQDDNTDLAILWESKGGLYANGKRSPSGSHAVLLLGGDVTNVSSVDWAKFLSDQAILQKAAFLKHKPFKS
jgi:hypothetical protein